MSELVLPHRSNQLFLTDAGLETELVFLKQFELPCFAAFPLLQSHPDVLREYYERFAALAVSRRCGCVLETPTWRANPDWAQALGVGRDELARANRDAVALMQSIRQDFETPDNPFVVSGNVGPRGDGYVVGDVMTTEEAQAYHGFQIGVFAAAGVDMVSAFTLTYTEEAVGIVRAAQECGLEVVIAFTTETDGTLPSGQSLQSAIEAVDAACAGGPAYYMINCAHPDHFSSVLTGQWVQRIGGLRANASRCSHAELDACEVLDDGDPVELGAQYRALLGRHPDIRVLGGCCGTDIRHIEQIAVACC